MRQQQVFPRVFGGLCLIWLLLNLPVLLGIRVLPWDAIDAFYPSVYFNAHSLRMGLAPWWNPYVYAGYPQIADPQGMLFSPLLMAWMLLKLSPGPTWFAWAVLLHVLMGGTATLALLRRSGANAFGSLIGATVFMAGGVAASRLEHTTIIIAYAYAPVVLLALQYFLADPSWRRSLLFGVAAGAMVTQLVQVTYLFALMTVGYFLIASATHWPAYTRATRWRWAGGTLLAVLCALLIALPQLMFSWAFVSLSNRSVLALSSSAPASLDWRALQTLFDPNARHALRGVYSGPADKVEAFFYLGAVPSLLLLGIGMAWREVAQRRQMVFFTMVALIAWIYALGVHGALYGWLFDWLPGMSLFRRPSDAAFLINFSFAILIGHAASHFRLDSRRQLTLLLSIATIWLLLSSLGMRQDWTDWKAESLLAAFFSALALYRLQRPGSTRRAGIWLLLLLVVDYRCYNLNGSFNQGHNRTSSFKRDAMALHVRELQRPSPATLPLRVETEAAGTSWDNQVVVAGIASTQGYNPLRYGMYDQWYGARETAAQPRPTRPFNLTADSKLTDLLSVGYLVHGVDVDRRPWSAPEGYRKIFTTATAELWENSRAYARLLTPTSALTQTAIGLPTPAAFAATDFRDRVWLTPRDEDDRRSGDMAATTCSGRLQIDSAQSEFSQIAVRTSSATAGWLVLSELDFPGWVANVDGSVLPIHRANGMFRAICVPAGEHTVTLVFHPWTMVAEVWRQRKH